MINNLQKLGGLAALTQGLLYIAGFTIALTLLVPNNAANLDYVQKLAFVLENKAVFQTFHLLIYLAFGVFLVILVISLHERLKAASSAVMQIASAFGLIWAGLVIASGMIANVGLDSIAIIYGRDPAQATSVWLALSAVQDGLGGGIEMVGGLWVLLVSCIALRTSALPKVLNYLGLLVGMVGVLTSIPAFGDLVDVFGLSQILWFIWLGIFMLRNSAR